ncbi:MAG: peptidoglycan-binding domain-containing protein [Acidimicrobiales bacterium]|jgi:hypothetical protein
MPFHPYVVRQGDHLRRLAADGGFDADTVWNDPANAKLKDLRTTYNILLPGDILQLPDADPNWVALDTGTTNAFTAPANKPLTITHTFVCGDAPATTVNYRTVGAVDDDTPKTTDENGKATFDAPVEAESVQIVFEDGSSYLLNVGHLDPAATLPGAEQRLMQLGYLDDVGDLTDDEDGRAERDQCLAVALSAFQAKNGLPCTGALDSATVQKLADVYGC